MKHRWISLGLLLATALTATVWVGVDYRHHPRIVNGPLVQGVRPDGFILAWEVHPARPLEVTLTGPDGRTRTVAPQLTGSWCEATIAGLKPDTLYTYTIAGEPNGSARIRTAPTGPKPFRFLAFGDSGDGERPQYRIARQLARWTPDLIIHTGDLVYPRGRIEDYPAHFFRPYAELIASVPLYPCLGNHDVRTDDGSALLDVFRLPHNGPPGQQPEREYWFDYGPVRFVALDTNYHTDHLGAHVAPWLEGVLRDAGDRWKIVFFHEPVYTHGKYTEALKLHETIVPVLDRTGVHLVLSGHNHMYERTFPMRGGVIAPDGAGTVYVTTGAGGAGLYDLRPDPPAYLAAWNGRQHSFTVVDVTPEVLVLRQIGENGLSFDEAFIRRTDVPATSVAQR